MAELLTQERADFLSRMPKRIIRPDEFAWHPLAATDSRGASRSRIMRVRLLGEDSRESFLLIGAANGSFSFKLKWNKVELCRVDSAYRHKLPKQRGDPTEFIYGPHVHYFVPGHGVEHAFPTTEYDSDDPLSALSFFLRHCAVQDYPPLQEILELR
jgi:hypothetical protein